MGAERLRVERRGGALVLTLATGPSNALSHAVRAALIHELSRADADWIVLAGAGATFSSGLPIEPDPHVPDLAELCAAVETAPVPVVVSLHGLVMGPGAELALAAGLRLAAPGTRIAFPEVALGLCPEGGTSRRLVERIGATEALRLLVSGQAVAAEAALELGLVDAIAADPLALALQPPTLPVRVSRPAAETLSAIAAARRSHRLAMPAVQRIIDCVEAGALLPEAAHRAFEAAAREDLAATVEAQGLCAAARAERRAASLPPAIARSRPGPIDRISLHGAAPDLVTLARAALTAGLAVAWHHPSAADRAASLAALDLAQAAEQRAGRMTAAARHAAQARLSDGAGPEEVSRVRIHASSPNPLVLPPVEGVVQLVLDGTEDEFGLAIAPSLRSSELAVLAEESPEAIALAVAALRRIGLPPVLVGQRPVLGRRVMAAGETALAHLVRSGVPQRLLGEALAGFGAALPPGLPEPAATVQPMSAPEITRRWLAALANEALRLLDLGIARRPSDIDHALVAGHGFPRWRGGLMHQAELSGLMVLRRDLRQWAEEHPVWSPAPLIDRLIRDGLRLPDLEG